MPRSLSGTSGWQARSPGRYRCASRARSLGANQCFATAKKANRRHADAPDEAATSAFEGRSLDFLGFAGEPMSIRLSTPLKRHLTWRQTCKEWALKRIERIGFHSQPRKPSINHGGRNPFLLSEGPNRWRLSMNLMPGSMLVTWMLLSGISNRRASPRHDCRTARSCDEGRR